jgi:hypothetical protein
LSKYWASRGYNADGINPVHETKAAALLLPIATPNDFVLTGTISAIPSRVDERADGEAEHG